jgi:hypothetical protein
MRGSAGNGGRDCGRNGGRSDVPEEPGHTKNEQFAWNEFDPEAYVSHYYSDPHPDDERAVGLASLALAAAEPAGALLKVVDIGTGPNLFPLLAALPRGSQLTAWEFSENNVRWLNAELQRSTIGEPWRHFWEVVRSAYGTDLPADPMPALRERTRVRRGSVFELPERQWDAATMFFCAESITALAEEFQQACARFARCVRPGGTLVAAFLLSSDAYVVAGRRYPVLNLSEDMLGAAFRPIADQVKIQTIGDAGEEIRSGYSRMAFLTARSR